MPVLRAISATLCRYGLRPTSSMGAHPLADLSPQLGVVRRLHQSRLGPWWMGQTEWTTLLTQGVRSSSEMFDFEIIFIGLMVGSANIFNQFLDGRALQILAAD